MNYGDKWYYGDTAPYLTWGDVNLYECKLDDDGDELDEYNIESIVKKLDKQFKIVGISSTELEYDNCYKYIPKYDGYTIDDIDKYLNYEEDYSGALLQKGHDEVELYFVGSYEVE